MHSYCSRRGAQCFRSARAAAMGGMRCPLHRASKRGPVPRLRSEGSGFWVRSVGWVSACKCGPLSTTTPWSSTTMRLQWRTVDRRCATDTAVRPAATCRAPRAAPRQRHRCQPPMSAISHRCRSRAPSRIASQRLAWQDGITAQPSACFGPQRRCMARGGFARSCVIALQMYGVHLTYTCMQRR